MRSKLLITAILTLISVSSAYAKTDITGDIYGQILETINMTDGGTYGVTIEDLGDANCDNLAQTCLLDGFSWSDVMGWTYWDGMGLQGELGVLDFPNENRGRITYNGNLEGYIWGEKYGWVSLSACNGLDNASCGLKSYCNWAVGGYCEANTATRVPEVSSQDVDDWGAYLDFCPLKQTQGECESLTSDQYCEWDTSDPLDIGCIFDEPANSEGQPFGGYVWSEYLGWIKFGPETGEETDFSGAFTKWFPDLTPPDITIPDPNNPNQNWDPATMDPLFLWIPNESTFGAIEWESFVDENDSFVDLSPGASTIKVNKVGATLDFTGCPPAADKAAIINPVGGGAIDLMFTNIGHVGREPPNGFCRYELGGVLYNGSGFGFYFGDEGTTIATNKGIIPGDPSPNIYDADPITIFIRAGDPQPTEISVTSTNNGPVADGNNPIGTSFYVTDASASNRIVSVKADIDGNIIPGDPSNWIRKVDLLYDLNSSLYNFDSIDWTRDLGKPIPISIEGDASYSILSPDLKYPSSGLPYSPTPVLGEYPLDLIGYAPTTVGNTLEIDTIELTTNDIDLPAISPTQGPWDADSDPHVVSSSDPHIMDSSDSPANLPFVYNYEPALSVTDGYLDSNFLSISQAAEATFKFTNNSIATLDEYSLDHILSFTDGGIGAELLEIKDIDLIPISADTGRTDSDLNGVATRYGLLYSALDDPGSNRFHSITDNYHDPLLTFENPTDSDGVYAVSGDAYVSPTADCLKNEPTTCEDIFIDRSDLLAGNELIGSEENEFTFTFTPSRFFAGSSSGQITFDLDQYIAHLTPTMNPVFGDINNHPYTLYPATPFIQGIQVKSLGLETSGTVSGGQIFQGGGGRDLETITTTSSLDLRREIRKNVAVLTRSMTACEPAGALPALEIVASDCVAIDKVNKTIVALYSGSNTIVLENGGVDVEIPDEYRYTIILDAVDLSIEENIIYPDPADPNTSFGMIVIQDSDGNGGNVYLDPGPTNIAGLLYAEGSLLSRDATGQFYYGAGGDSSDLGNQLYWQGSIASKNTIGGASSLVTPEGDDPDSDECASWSSDAQCSQAYDLDFIRRFTTINELGVEYSPTGSFFSGGGECFELPLPITCTYGGLPTTVTISANTIDVDLSKSLDTFFIERSQRPVPPGFSSSGGFTSTKEIR